MKKGGRVLTDAELIDDVTDQRSWPNRKFFDTLPAIACEIAQAALCTLLLKAKASSACLPKGEVVDHGFAHLPSAIIQFLKAMLHFVTFREALIAAMCEEESSIFVCGDLHFPDVKVSHFGGQPSYDIIA
jgi:hypothetical protein